MAITRAQQVRQMLKDGDVAIQGGVENYLGKQPEVQAPRKWQSSPDKPATELAYITEAEKDLIIKENIHGGLEDGPNMGPSGIISLDSFGDIGGAGAAGGDTDPGGGYDTGPGGGGFTGRTVSEMGGGRKADQEYDRRIANEKAKLQMAERKQAKALGYDERENIADYGSADPLQRLYMRGVPKSTFPGFISMGLNALTPFRNMTLRKNIDYFRDLEDVESKGYPKTLEGYKQYMSDRLAGKIDAAGNPNPGYDRDGGGGDGGMSDYERRLLELENQLKDQQAAAPTTTQSPFAYRFFADGGSAGGIMDADIVGGMMDGNMDEMGRQMYGLGKLVKKATRAVKKIAKSPIGKAALLYGGGTFLGGLKAFGGAGLGSGTFLSNLKSGQGLANLGGFLKGKLFASKTTLPGTKSGGLLNFLKDNPGLTIAGFSALPFIFGEQDDKEEFDPYRGPDIDIAKIRSDPYAAMGQAYRFAADGGLMRQNYDEAGAVMSKEEMKKLSKSPLYKGFKLMYGVDPQQARDNDSYKDKFSQFEQLYKKGYQEGGDVEPVAKKTMPLIDMDGKEKDYRETGGFVDMGRMERADDVPARLSKNEFVFTADAVRNAGDGDVDKGAEVMYNMMKNLEAGGEVSEESQGLEGARKMFQTSQRLEEVL